MIASTPVARWSWGEFGRDTDLVREAVRRLTLVLEVLDRHHLGTPHGGRVKVAVSEPGAQHRASHDHFNVSANPETLVEEIRGNLPVSPSSTLDIDVSCDGLLSTGVVDAATEGVLTLDVEVSDAFFLVGLTTFSDAWMRYDLKGREQAAVFAANRPRLATALAEISEALGVEIDPEDSTWFGIPTETGVENELDRDGCPQDVWGSFEIPYRNRVFQQTPGFTPGYARETSGPVLYVPVKGERQVLGYLWASDADHAASFEPTEVADLDAHRAGLVWLERLHQAYEQGLEPRAALTEMTRYPVDPVAGHASEADITEVERFWTLQMQAAGMPTDD